MSQRFETSGPSHTIIRAWRGWLVLWFGVAAMVGVGIGQLIGADRASDAPRVVAEGHAAPGARGAARTARTDSAGGATTPLEIWPAP